MNFKYVPVFAICIGIASAGNCLAWGLPNIIQHAVAPSGGADPDAFLARARAAERLIGDSSTILFRAVASKEEQAKLEELRTKLNETADDKEKHAIRQQITESEMATIEKRAADKDLQREARHWDEKKKRQIGHAFYNFSLGAMQAALLVPEGTRIANAIQGNPVNAVMLALKITSVFEAVKALTGILSNTGKVISAMKPLMSAADIQVKSPSSASESPREIEGGL